MNGHHVHLYAASLAYLRDDVGGGGEEEEDDEEEDVYEEGLEEEEAVRVVQVLPIDILRRRGKPHRPAASWTGNDWNWQRTLEPIVWFKSLLFQTWLKDAVVALGVKTTPTKRKVHRVKVHYIRDVVFHKSWH